MCISDNTRRRTFLTSADAAALLAPEVVKNESPEPSNVSNKDSPKKNESSRKAFTYSEPTAVITSSAFKVNDEAMQVQPDRQHCVQHNYHDHAGDIEEMYNQTKPVVKGGIIDPFPMKLYDMLEHINSNEPELASIVSWQPHGRCFLVHKPKEFTEYILPRFFQQRKYASFQRQLNLYDFSRITRQGPDRGSYYHELFLRGKKFLCRDIIRLRVKGTGTRMASNPDAEPDFYAMTPIATIKPSQSETETESDSSVTLDDMDSILRNFQSDDWTSSSILTPSQSERENSLTLDDMDSILCMFQSDDWMTDEETGATLHDYVIAL